MNASSAAERDVVGPYRLLKAIGAGGSARVDLARIDRAYGFQRHVVLKRPLEHLRGDARAAASLHREARIGGLLRHPHLVAVLDAGVHDDYDYLVLEYVHGASLRTLMESDSGGRVRDMPANVALAIVTDVARGLHHAHELVDEHGTPLGLVHRDVSPGNILVAQDGAVKLADFGIAKETRVATLSGSMHGTVTYMAPEQCRGHAFDRRADVFSLGVILYELVTGMRLFWADNDVASLHRVLSGTVTRPRKIRPLLAPALEDIVMTAIAHEPERRFATARAFADAIEQHAAGTGELLGARWVAHWVESVLGRRDVPWVTASNVPDAAARGDGSLVDLIAAMPEDAPADQPDTQFGPNDPNGTAEPEHLPTDRSAQPYRGEPDAAAERTRARRNLVAVVVGGVAISAALMAFVMTRTNDSTAPVPRERAPSVEPPQPDTGSAKPDTVADKPNLVPDKPDTAPDKPDVAPDKPDIAPAKPDIVPDTGRPKNTTGNKTSEKRTSQRGSETRTSTKSRTGRTPDSRTSDKAPDKQTADKTPDNATDKVSDKLPSMLPDKTAPAGHPDSRATDKDLPGTGSGGKPARTRAWNPDQLLPDDPAQGSGK